MKMRRGVKNVVAEVDVAICSKSVPRASLIFSIRQLQTIAWRKPHARMRGRGQLTPRVVVMDL